MTLMSETPRTDRISELACDRPEGDGWAYSFGMMREHARKLERELAAALERVRELEGEIDTRLREQAGESI